LANCSVLLSRTVSLINKLLIGNTLKAKSTRGVTALSVGNVVERGMRGARNMILARIIAPDDFGAMAIVLVTTMAFEAFAEVGVKQAVIQNKRGNEREYLNVAWWFQSLRGLGLFAIAILVAPYISSFFEKPQLLSLFQISFLSILFRGFLSPRLYVLEKEYKFGKAVLLVQGSGVLGTVITIVAAFMIRNVWALVIGFVAEAAMLCLFSYILVPFLPRFRIDRECLRELMKFARGMFGLPILAMLSFQIDVMVLGKLVSDKDLGMYFLAISLVNIPMDFFSRVVGPILLPTFAENQSDKAAVRTIVLKITKVVAILALPFTAFLAVCASSVLSVAYGLQYAAAAVPFMFLCARVSIRAQNIVLAQLYLGLGRPYLLRRFNIIRIVVLVSLIYPGVLFFGLSGAAAVVLLGGFAALCFQILQARRVAEFKFSSYIRCYVPGLLLALPVMGIVAVLRLSGVHSPVWILTGGALALTAAFIGGVFTLNYHKPSAIKKVSEDKLDYLSSAEVRSV